MKRKTYNAEQLAQLVNDLKKYGLDFAVQYLPLIRKVKLYTRVKNYYYTVDDTIQTVIVNEDLSLTINLKYNVEKFENA